MRHRVRLLLVERYSLYGGSVGALAAGLLVLLSPRVTELLDYRLWVGTVLVGSAAGCVFGLLRWIDDLTLAIAADGRTGSKERISTAVCMQRTSNRTDMGEALVRDAVEYIGTFRPSEVFRHKFGFPHALYIAALLLLAGVVFLPQMKVFQSKQRQQEVAVMKSTGEKMVRVAGEIKKVAGTRHQDFRRLAARLDRLGKQMQTGRMEKKTAMLKTRRLSRELRRAQDELAKSNSKPKSMEEARTEISKSSEGLAREAAEKMAEARNIPLEAAMQKIPSDKRLAELSSKPGKLSKSEEAELAKLLSKYNRMSKYSIPKELAQSIAKLAENGNYKKAAEIMQKLAVKLNSGNLSEADKEALGRQLKELAKAFQGTKLDKLSKQLRDDAGALAKMKPEELEKMVSQMKKDAEMASLLAKAESESKDATCSLGLGSLPGLPMPGQNPGVGPGTENGDEGPHGKLHDAKETVKVSTAVGESGMVYSGGVTKGAPDLPGTSKVPYTAVLPDARKAAESALTKNNVPPAYRKRVKDYFSSLQ